MVAATAVELILFDCIAFRSVLGKEMVDDLVTFERESHSWRLSGGAREIQGSEKEKGGLGRVSLRAGVEHQRAMAGKGSGGVLGMSVAHPLATCLRKDVGEVLKGDEVLGFRGQAHRGAGEYESQTGEATV